ncbi:MULTISPECIES: alpha/beta hydrolase [Listeria]|uniref:alpha/beta hydrolase n=1 Tax=Listeria TaxID=1637 RepID=UPI000B593ABA|nr:MULTISPECIES: alpha/beta hydrolase [Listeria]
MRKATVISLLAVFFVSIVAIFGVIYVKTQQEEAKVKETIIPTVFVHGYKGTANSFGHLLNRIGSDSRTKQIAMQIMIKPNGQLKVRGHLDSQYKNGDSAVQILFEDNRASLSKQTLWLQNAMKYIREKEHIKTVNLVGHSMGGLAILSYLENTPVDAAYPVPQKFIAIATPFNGIDRADYFKLQKDPAAHDLKAGSDALKNLAKNKTRIPKTIQMLAIAGDQNHTGTDGLVQVDSVFYARNFFPKANYQERLISGTNVTHSGLHESFEVDALLSQFLWDLPDGMEKDNGSNLDTVPNVEK